MRLKAGLRAVPTMEAFEGSDVEYAHISYEPIMANGTLAEWVESCPATIDQRTVIYFAAGPWGQAVLERSRLVVAPIAASTGARVLSISCETRSAPSGPEAVESAIAAYAWLLAEGCDLRRTTLLSDPTDQRLVEAVLVTAKARGLALPSRATMPTRLRIDQPRKERWPPEVSCT